MGKQLKLANKTKLSLSWGAVTDTGRIREENQDAWFTDFELGLFLISDGMGGLQAGGLASQIVAKVLPVMIKDGLAKFNSYGSYAMKSMIRKAVLELSQQMRIQSANQTGFKGMGATLVMALVRNDCAYIANMGDSRAYLFRRGKLRQLSEDHSVIALLLRSGEISPEKAKIHPARGQLSRYIGMADKVDPFIRTVTLKENDRLLLCSDGLTGVLNDDEIASILEKNTESQNACSVLVETANLNGGLDNITVVVIDWHGCSSKS